MSGQLDMLAADQPEIPEHRVRALAGVLAGFRWPDRDTFEHLRKYQQAACMREARNALAALAREEGD